MVTLNCQAAGVVPAVMSTSNQFMLTSAVQPMMAQPPQVNTNNKGSGNKKVGNSKQSGKADSDKPKRPLSAYNLFFQHERAQILKSTPSKYEGNKPRRSHGKIGFASLARSVASKWNNIDAETRKHFDELAAADKARYKKEMEVWKAAQTLKQNNTSASTTNNKNNDMNTKDLLPPPTSMMSMSMPPTMNAQSITKFNLMAASHASQHTSRMVFSKFQNTPAAAANNIVGMANAVPATATPSGSFFFQNLHNCSSNNANNNVIHVGKASTVVGQALALLDEDCVPSSSSSSSMPQYTFQPLDDDTLNTVESSEDSSLSSSCQSSCSSSRRGSGNTPHISELAAKLDDDCLGFMSELLF